MVNGTTIDSLTQPDAKSMIANLGHLPLVGPGGSLKQLVQQAAKGNNITYQQLAEAATSYFMNQVDKINDYTRRDLVGQAQLEKGVGKEILLIMEPYINGNAEQIRTFYQHLM